MTDSGKLITAVHDYKCVTLHIPGALNTVIDRHGKHYSKIIEVACIRHFSMDEGMPRKEEIVER